MKNSSGSLSKIAFGTGIGIFFSVFVIGIMAGILSIGNIPSVILHPMTVFVYITGGFVSGFCSAKFAQKNGIVFGAISGLVFFLILFIIGNIANTWDFNIVSLVKFGLITVAGVLGGIIGVNQ